MRRHLSVALVGSVATLFLVDVNCGPNVPVAQEGDSGSIFHRDGRVDGNRPDAGNVEEDAEPAPDGSTGVCTPGRQEDCYEGPTATLGRGECAAGTRTCDSTGHWGPCLGQVLPQEEHCNNLDDDCDGETDDDVECLAFFQDCTPEVDECAYPYSCVDHPGHLTYCDDRRSCTDCGSGETCQTYPDGYDSCYREPKTTCWAHILTVQTEGSQGRHLDSCMNCRGDSGSSCMYTQQGQDLSLNCHGYILWPRQGLDYTDWYDFMTADFPFRHPENVDKCLVAWGVFPLVQLQGDTPRLFMPDGTAIIRLTGGASNNQPLQAEGLRTSLPAAAFLVHEVASPPHAANPNPQSKDERAALVFWTDPSATNLQNTNMPYPYQTCPNCQTWGDLVDHLYPGPEINCQGVGDNQAAYADSSFVVPLWYPYYDAQLGTRHLALVTEMVCRYGTGEQTDAVTVVAIPENMPQSLPQTYQ